MAANRVGGFKIIIEKKKKQKELTCSSNAISMYNPVPGIQYVWRGSGELVSVCYVSDMGGQFG